MLTGLPHPLASSWFLANSDFQQEIEGKEEKDGVFFPGCSLYWVAVWDAPLTKFIVPVSPQHMDLSQDSNNYHSLCLTLLMTLHGY